MKEIGLRIEQPDVVFTPAAARSLLGQRPQIRMPDGSTSAGHVVAAELLDGGTGVELTVRLYDDDPLERRLSRVEQQVDTIRAHLLAGEPLA